MDYYPNYGFFAFPEAECSPFRRNSVERGAPVPPEGRGLPRFCRAVSRGFLRGFLEKGAGLVPGSAGAFQSLLKVISITGSMSFVGDAGSSTCRPAPSQLKGSSPPPRSFTFFTFPA